MNSQPDLIRNMDQAREAVAHAAHEGARFVALPENFAFLGSEREKHRLAEPISEAVRNEIPKWAREYGIWLLAGGFPVRVGSGNHSSGDLSSNLDRKSGDDPDNDKVYNRAIVAAPSGFIIARYDKIHLFDVAISAEDSYRESKLVEPGSPVPVVFDIPVTKTGENFGQPAKGESMREEAKGEASEGEAAKGATENGEPAEQTLKVESAGQRIKPRSANPNSVNAKSANAKKVTSAGKKDAGIAVAGHGGVVRVGLSICYDVRFPELYRRLGEMGADILCVPAAFTRPTGEAHWETLLRARAIENSCYVIAPAQTGRHGKKRLTHGHSLIIDPWGSILADAGTSPGTIFAEINPEHIQDIRKKLPSIYHRAL